MRHAKAVATAALPKWYKIDVNAQQNHLTGLVLLSEACNLVLVEGGAADALWIHTHVEISIFLWNSSMETV